MKEMDGFVVPLWISTTDSTLHPHTHTQFEDIPEVMPHEQSFLPLFSELSCQVLFKRRLNPLDFMKEAALLDSPVAMHDDATLAWPIHTFNRRRRGAVGVTLKTSTKQNHK